MFNFLEKKAKEPVIKVLARERTQYTTSMSFKMATTGNFGLRVMAIISCKAG